MSQRYAMVLLVTGTVAVAACKDNDQPGTLDEHTPKSDASVSHVDHDAASQDEDPDVDEKDDASVDPALDASNGLDAATGSDAGGHDASEPEADASTDDAGTDASVAVTLPLSAAGQVIITEIMAAPFTATKDDNDGEWVEIYNPSANTTYELENCTFSDKPADADYAFGAITIAPHSYLVLSSTAFTETVQGFVSDAVYGTDSGLSAKGDSPIIRCGGVIVDMVDYAAAGFPKPGDSEGHAMQLSASKLDGTQNDTGANWCFSTQSYHTVTTDAGDVMNYGTPKAENDECP